MKLRRAEILTVHVLRDTFINFYPFKRLRLKMTEWFSWVFTAKLN